jgi:hypothetical protein
LAEGREHRGSCHSELVEERKQKEKSKLTVGKGRGENTDLHDVTDQYRYEVLDNSCSIVLL